MLEKITSYILIIAAIILALQEDFLINKIPFTSFYGCKLLLKTLSIRANFGETRTLKDLFFLLLACFGKKIVFDLAFHQIHYFKYFKYIVILVCIDYVLLLLSKRGYKAKNFIRMEPVKTCLTLGSGLCDSISLENLLWRNELGYWHLPMVFLFVIVDPLLFTLTSWVMKGQKKEKNYKTCQKSMNFGIFLTIAHWIFSKDGYSRLIHLRRKIPFNSSNVMTFSVGIRLLNCFSYIALVIFDLVQSHIVNKTPVVVKDNVVKINPFRKSSDDMSTNPSLTSLDGDDDVVTHTHTHTHKPSIFAKRARSD